MIFFGLIFFWEGGQNWFNWFIFIFYPFECIGEIKIWNFFVWLIWFFLEGGGSPTSFFCMILLVRVKLGYTPNFTFLRPLTLLVHVGGWVGVVGWVDGIFGNKANLKSFGHIFRCGKIVWKAFWTRLYFSDCFRFP